MLSVIPTSQSRYKLFPGSKSQSTTMQENTYACLYFLFDQCQDCFHFLFQKKLGKHIFKIHCKEWIQLEDQTPHWLHYSESLQQIQTINCFSYFFRKKT